MNTKVFKVGDRVRWLDAHPSVPEANARGTVLEANDMLTVRWDNWAGESSMKPPRSGVYPDEIELIDPVTRLGELIHDA